MPYILFFSSVDDKWLWFFQLLFSQFGFHFDNKNNYNNKNAIHRDGIIQNIDFLIRFRAFVFLFNLFRALPSVNYLMGYVSDKTVFENDIIEHFNGNHLCYMKTHHNFRLQFFPYIFSRVSVYFDNNQNFGLNSMKCERCFKPIKLKTKLMTAFSRYFAVVLNFGLYFCLFKVGSMLPYVSFYVFRIKTATYY